MDLKKIRNFCIIAHIDHWKSTLADRLLEITWTIEKRDMKHWQMLDTMELEQERWITIKLQPVRMNWKGYELNIIDTPGHVDFQYEVSRSLASVEWALLIVDAAQGIEAQTLSNVYMAIENDLDIIPVINKIDLPAADVEKVTEEIVNLIGCDPSEIIPISAKTGQNVEAVLEAVIERVESPRVYTSHQPSPEGEGVNKFTRMTFDEAIENYGTDKPDLRYGMKLIDVADIFARSTNEIFSSIASDTDKNRVKAIKVTNWDNYFSKTQMKNFEKFVRQFGAQGLGYFQMKEDWLKGPLNKFFSEADLSEIVERTDLKTGDVIFFWAADKETVCDYMGKFRVHLAELINTIEEGKFINKDILAFSWITDFPMFEINEITGKVDFGHNPFSMPKGWIKAFEEEDLLKVSSVQYDLACNGFEVLSGSIRNHDIAALVKAFEKVGRTEEEVKEKFWAMYEAFQYWVPPHGGFAIGMDRIMMILKDESNIREVYAFPKSGKAQDLMMNAPAFIEENQLEELHIEVVEKDED